MKKNIKTILAAFMAGTLALSVVGCASDSKETTSSYIEPEDKKEEETQAEESREQAPETQRQSVEETTAGTTAEESREQAPETQSQSVEETTAGTTETEETVVATENQDAGMPAAYQAIIDDIASYLDDQAAMFENHMGIAELMANSSRSETEQKIGITLYDFNNDGIEELFIVDLSWGNDNSRNILEMYTLDGDEAYTMIRSGSARNRYYLFDDMVIMNIGSAGAAYSYVSFSTTAPNGLDLEDFECYWSDTECYGGAPDGYDVYWYTSNDRNDLFNSDGNGVFFATESDMDYSIIDEDNGSVILNARAISEFI